MQEIRYHHTVMRKSLIPILAMILMAPGLRAEKIADLPRVNRPNNLVFHKNRIYISDCPQVHIYSFRQGRLNYLKSIGQAGSGPGEFEPNHNHFKVFTLPKRMVVYSRAKMAYFTLEGTLTRELNTLSLARVLVPIQDRLVGRRLYMKGTTRYRGVTLFDSHLQQLKTLNEQVYAMQPGGTRIKIYNTSFNLAASRDRIFTATSDSFIIRVYDIQGNPLHVIGIPDSDIRVKITKERKVRLRRYLELKAPNYPLYRERLDFADFFPAIRYNGLCVDASTDSTVLYALTWKKRDEDTRVYMFDGDGEVQGKLWLPLREQDALLLYPYCIRGHSMYQLIENPDTETFELHHITF